MRKYEVVLLINQDVPHQGVAVIAKKIESLLEDSGKILRSEYWGLRELAYQIGTQKKARYYMLCIEVLPETVKIVSDYIRINESILRSAVYAVEEFDAKNSQMLTYTKSLSENTSESDYKALFPHSITVSSTTSN